MSKILELREKRARLWETAKNFLDSKRGADGLVSAEEIIVPGPNRLSFVYEDGRRVDLTWRHPSRRDSWTPEMREAARQKSLERSVSE